MLNSLTCCAVEDIPRTPHTLPRPLTAEQDQLLQQEFLRRNDLGGNVFLLLRHSGMRIGECVDLSYDCLRSAGPNQGAIHVPLGKLKTERMVPVDAFVRELVHRLRFFRSLDPLPADGRLLAWPGTKVSLLARLREYLHMVCYSADPRPAKRSEGWPAVMLRLLGRAPGGLQDTFWAAVLAWRWRKSISVRSTSAKPAPPL